MSATACTICNPLAAKPYAYPKTFECYDECPSGTYLDLETTMCTTCESPCYTCSSKDTCLTCDRTDINNLAIFYSQVDGKCYSECPDTAVPTPSKQCESCVYPCETCDKLTNNCLTCVEGLYFHINNECIETCPFLYYNNDENRECSFFGELGIPVPFSIAAFVMTVGVAVSSFVKGSNS